MEITFRRQGRGPCLLLLHGAMCDSRVWRRELETLSDAFTVVAWDAPGCGGSSDPPPQFRMPQYAECLGRFADALGIDRPHLLGHSWGSALALELARQRPGDIRSLILVGAYAGWAGSLPPGEVDRRLQLALDVAAKPPRAFEPESMRGLFSDAMPEDRADELREIMSEVRPAGTVAMARALAESDLRDVLPHIAVPTLVMCGDADERSPVSVAQQLHAAIPESRLAVLPGLGHECFLESPDVFAAELRAFLSVAMP
jgi:pimeloyl-ACP methyl ester carboxylesterase